MKEKNSLIVYYEWEEMFSYMSDKQIADMLRAMFGYAKRGDIPQFSNPLLNSNFCIIKYAIDRDNCKYIDKCNKNKAKAIKRWEKEKCNSINNMPLHKKYTDNDKDNENDNDKDNDNISTSSSSKMRVCEVSGDYSDDFLEFWKAYPKKMGKGSAYKCFNKLKLTKKEKEDIISALKWQKKSEQWLKDNGQFIPYPATYLNQRRWEDEPQRALCGDITDPDRYKDDEEDDFDFNIKEVSL